MKNLLVLLSLPILIAVQCNKQQSEIPSCIQAKIDQIKAKPKWNPPATVNEYIYQGKHVFLISSDCCDQYNLLVDENCNLLCAPSGGITGNGDGKCADFSSASQFVKLVWEDSR